MSQITITLCSSAHFYRQAGEIADKLETMGFIVLLPAAAQEMKASGDYDVAHYKTWFGDANDYHKKTVLIQNHFDEVAKSDAILVLNYEKHDTPNYIGGNVLMEMAVAFYLKKPIYLLNEVPEESAFLEEIIGMNPIPLHGNMSKIHRSI